MSPRTRPTPTSGWSSGTAPRSCASPRPPSRSRRPASAPTASGCRSCGQDDKKKAQVWTLSRMGGEAQKLTDVKGGVSDYAWSPDSTRLVLASRDVDPDATDERQARQGPQADRDRDVQVQARRRGLRGRQAPHAPVPLRHRDQGDHAADVWALRSQRPRHGRRTAGTSRSSARARRPVRRPRSARCTWSRPGPAPRRAR